MENINELNLNDTLTIQEVSEMANTIKTIFDSGNKIAIDVSNIQRIDGAGLQLLCVLVKEANEKDIAIAWKGESQSFREAVSKCGLTDILRFVTN